MLYKTSIFILPKLEDKWPKPEVEKLSVALMATRGRISNAPISRIVRNTFANIYAKFGAFIPKGNDFTG